MSTATCHGDKQTPRKLLIEKNDDCLFSVKIDYGDSYAWFDLDIVDQHVNVIDVLKKIAADETHMTCCGHHEGSIHMEDENGREFRVATFDRHEAQNEEMPEITFFAFPARANLNEEMMNEVVITPDELDGLQIEIAEYDEEDNLIVA